VSRDKVDAEVEAFRQIVVAAQSSAGVEPEAHRSIGRLNALYQASPDLFTEEDIRFVNVLAGFLGERLEAHRPSAPAAPRHRRKGDKLDHCWRCKIPIDERFGATCEACSSKKYAWMICPVCRACGCQRDRKVLV